METDKRLAELIRRSLEDYEETYIPGAWEQFAQKQRERKKRRYLFYAVAAAACFLLVLLGGIVMNMTLKDVNGKRVGDMAIENRSARPENLVSPVQKKSEFVTPGTTDHSLKRTMIGKHLSRDVFHRDPLALNKTVDASRVDVAQSVPDSSASEETVPEARTETIAAGENTRTKDIQVAYDSADRTAVTQPEATSVNHKIRLGVNISSGINSTSTSVSSNYACGISADIPLTKRFFFSTGLSLERQKVLDDGNDQVSVASDRKTRAELMNLDIPMNLTWKFSTGKIKSYYVSGGISSLAYLKEKYKNTTYERQLSEQPAPAQEGQAMMYKIVQTETTTEDTEKPFQTFDFAGRINLIFGLEQRLSEHLYIQLEPFVKIPVSGLATQDLRYIVSGVACKFSF